MFEVLYTGPDPDLTKAAELLAFLLVPTSAFYDPSDSWETREAVITTIDSAKRNALMDWYARQTTTTV